MMILETLAIAGGLLAFGMFAERLPDMIQSPAARAFTARRVHRRQLRADLRARRTLAKAGRG